MPTPNPEATWTALCNAYDALEALVAREGASLLAPRPGSGWSPAQHVWHVAVVNGMMFKGIRLLYEGRHPQATHEGGPNEAGRRVLATGQMPRGYAQAPQNVCPPDTLTIAMLNEALQRSRRALEAIKPLLPELPDVSTRSPHPFLGMLNAMEWLQVARIHTDHHLRIIHELLGA